MVRWADRQEQAVVLCGGRALGHLVVPAEQLLQRHPGHDVLHARLSRPAYDLAYYTEANTKFTWQATPKQKVTGTYVTERNCNCFFHEHGTLAPEAAGSNLYDPNYRIQST